MSLLTTAFRKRWVFHPLLFALCPIAKMCSADPSAMPAQTLWQFIGLAWLFTGVLWGVAWLVLRNLERSAGVTSAIVLMLFAYDSLNLALGPLLGPAGVAVVWLGAAVLAVWLSGRKWPQGPTRYLNSTAVVLVALLGWQTASALHLSFTRKKVWASYFTSASNQRPDIYYIILDGYGRHDRLKAYTGLDDSAFIDGLERRGFFVANRSHSNYCQTEQSLGSSLNMSYLQDLVAPSDSSDRTDLDDLIAGNRVARTLQGKGYAFVAIRTGFPPVRADNADVVLPKSLVIPTFESAILDASPFESVAQKRFSQFENRRTLILKAFGSLGNVAEKFDEPCFVFAHVFAPHPPFVFDADGKPMDQPTTKFSWGDGDDYFELGGDRASYEKGYAAQAAYMGTLTLKAVDQILSQPGPRPVIIIQGDHGSKSRFAQDSLAGTDPNECFCNLNAYLVPKEVRRQLYPSITPVNSFRVILRSMFKLDLPDLPDRSYYSTWAKPHQFQEVTGRLKS